MHRSTRRPNTQTTAKGCARQTTLSEGPRQYKHPRAECAIWRLLGALSSRISLRAVLRCALLVVRAQTGKAWPAPAHGAAGPKGAAGPVVGSRSRFSGGRRQWVRRHVRGRRLGPGLTVCILTAAPAKNARWHLERHRTCAHSREAALGGRGQATQRNPQRKGNMRHVERDLAAAAAAAASAPASRAIYFLYNPPRRPLEGRRNGRTTSCSVQSTSSRRSRPASPS